MKLYHIILYNNGVRIVGQPVTLQVALDSVRIFLCNGQENITISLCSGCTELCEDCQERMSVSQSNK